MSVSLAVRFPLGRYHATPWDHSVNEGVVEWPPSPWRLLRALVSTWYTRWPDLPAPKLDALLVNLGSPPSYWTAPVRRAHSRHYMPGIDHKTGEKEGTSLTLDPYLVLPRQGDHLIVSWDADLAEEQQGVLAKLAELVPYLGRADSVCEMRLLKDVPPVDETWWRPAESGAETTRLLTPVPPVGRPALELSIVDVRRSRRTVPVESVWTTYARNSGEGVPTQERSQPVRLVQAIRLAVVTKAPLRATRGVLLADEFHRRVTRRLDGGRPEFLGHSGATTNHQHAHWVPIPRGFSRGEPIDALLVWVPGGLTNEEVAAVIGVQKVSGHRGDADNGYDLKGLPEVMLLLEAAGSVEQVAPELCGPARSWRSLTPYLPVRHRKRETMADYLTADVSRELSYRGLPSATTVEAVSPQDGPTDRWAIEFRRYRVLERLKDSRRGLGLRLRFATSVAGPLLLGQLSHFGFGIFVPDRETGP